ncbi:MAG: alpha/beta fold hydrolase [Alphaproteobacteria bacterium]|nr:alpha/beta fold hydrolase [Alphaproteobacteria bacterium]
MPTLKANGQTLYYELDGPSHAPVLLMLHGFLMDSRMFDPQVEALRDRYRCLRFDARAFGRTGWDGQAFSLYDTLADALALLDHLGVERAIWVGYSQGGYAALRAALNHPERVAALALLSTSADNDPAEGRAGMTQLRDAWRANGPLPDLINLLGGMLLGAPEDVPQLWAEWEPRFKAVSGEAYFHASNNLLDRDDISDRLAEIPMPAMIFHGRADVGIPPESAERLYRELPDARGLTIVPAAAHAANLSHPALANAALEAWLATLLRSRRTAVS